MTAIAASASCSVRCGDDESDREPQGLNAASDARTEPSADAREFPEVVSLSRRAAEATIWPGVDRSIAFRIPGDPDDMAALMSLLVAARGPRAPAAARAARLAREIGLELRSFRVGGDRFWALTEPPAARRGAGAYAIRLDRGKRRPRAILQAPHSYFELRTRAIAGELFFGPYGHRFDALFANSIQRYQSEPGVSEPRDDSPADVAHNPEHWFSAATKVVAAALQPAVVIQLHGFDETAEDRASGVYAIVSGGDKDEPTPLATRFRDRLRAAFGPGALLYPTDADRLGGTLNRQNQMVRGLPAAQFLHIELGRAIRERLAASPDESRRFGKALVAALEGERGPK